MKLTIDNLKELYRLSNIIRYNPWSKINTETVSSHSFFVALFTKMICDGLEVKPSIKLAALEFALVHDAPESLMNDITYDAKRLMPGINELLEKFEKQYLEKNFPETMKVAFIDEDSSEEDLLVSLIVKLADVYSVIQYCNNEVQLGNRPFEELLNEARLRAVEIHTKIERWFGIKCHKISLYVQ